MTRVSSKATPYQQLLAILIEEHILQCLLNVHALFKVFQIFVHVCHIAMNALKNFIKPGKDLQVILPKLFIPVLQLLHAEQVKGILYSRNDIDYQGNSHMHAGPFTRLLKGVWTIHLIAVGQLLVAGMSHTLNNTPQLNSCFHVPHTVLIFISNFVLSSQIVWWSIAFLLTRSFLYAEIR